MKLKIMGKTENDETEAKASTSSGECSAPKTKPRNHGKKRKRGTSESSNDDEICFPDNALETERNVHASAVKNNLDEASVRKIIKKVVTNDHVLALVKLREEEEQSSTYDKKVAPKLTRAKVKELKKVSTTKSAAWDLEKLELTPINHIPVKTRPEVKALIAQELPEDEDDDEYEPTHDDVPSDDDHVESCSDLDSQPRTPATPAKTPSPRVVRDGPFKVPLDISKARRKLDIEEEEATIALRTRSKLSLSATSIEHIESTFVPPDDIPIQDVDDLWNQFLNECLNPSSVSRHDDDDETLDETDPEYNVAADPDAHDEDEESLSNSIIKISKKELNDLVTELFNIMPETGDGELAITDTSQTVLPKWESKQEPVSDDETRQNPSKKLQFERELTPEKADENTNNNNVQVTEKEIVQREKACEPDIISIPVVPENEQVRSIEISVEEGGNSKTPQDVTAESAPPSLREQIKSTTATVQIQIDSNVTMSSDQLQIFQQQLRQHVQLAASNFMQTVVHPVHWKLAPKYKEYLESLVQLAEKKQDSVVDVCNLRPAFELITIWEESVTADTPENRKMIEFLVNDVEKSRRRVQNNSLYTGEFHDMLMKVVANSPVFLYPYLLPCMPFRPDPPRKFSYLPSEDTLIVLGLDQFWPYVENNPEIYKLPHRPHGRPGYNVTLSLVSKHMFPWITPNRLVSHITAVRCAKDELNPIYRYFKYNEVPKTEHMILPFNPALTLYELPEHEMPRVWARYLAKTSQRFKKYIQKRSAAIIGCQPTGTKIDVPADTARKPLPIAFTKKLVNSRSTLSQEEPSPPDRIDVNIQKPETSQNNVLVPQNFYRLVQTSTGAYLLPIQLSVDASTVDSTAGPITTPNEVSSIIANNLPEKRAPTPQYSEHCECCILLRKICKKRQSLITEFFRKDNDEVKCCCNSISYPKITNRLKLLVKNSKKSSEVVFKDIERTLRGEHKDKDDDNVHFDSEEMAHVLSYQVKVFTQASMCKRIKVKKRIQNLLSHFDLERGNPVKLAMDLYKAFDVELVDLYLDFMSFLNPEQAEKLAAFKDYFVRNCVKNLMEKVEELVHDKATRLAILIVLKTTISRRLSPCVMCSTLLRVMEGYGKLAHYTFHLFPHTKENRPLITAPVEPLAPLNTSAIDRDDTDVIDPSDTVAEHHTTAAYEADHSSSGEEDTVSRRDDIRMSVDHNRPPDPNANPASDTPTEKMHIFIKAKENSAANPSSKAQPLNQIEPLNQTQPLHETIPLHQNQPLNQTQPLHQNQPMNQTQPLNQIQPLNQTQPLNQNQPLHQVQLLNQTQLLNQSQPLNQTQHLLEVRPLNQVQPMNHVLEVRPLDQSQPSNNMEIIDSDSDSDHSLSIDENVNVKHEMEYTTEWTKEEDRTILKVIQEHVTKEERKDRTIVDLLEEKNVYGMIFQSIDRTMSQIKERVLYLLTLLVVSESDT